MFSCLAKGIGSWDSTFRTQTNYSSDVQHRGMTISLNSIASTVPLGENGELLLPKTYTTRKGALMLFADGEQLDYSQFRSVLNSAKSSKTHLLQEELEKLGSLSNLSSSVLMFGDEDYDETCSISNPDNKVFLRFLKSLDDIDIDLKVQPGGNTNDYLRNLKFRLLRAKMKHDEEGQAKVDQARLVKSTSAISGVETLEQDQDKLEVNFSKEWDQKKFDFPFILRTTLPANTNVIQPASSTFSIPYTPGGGTFGGGTSGGGISGGGTSGGGTSGGGASGGGTSGGGASGGGTYLLNDSVQSRFSKSHTSDLKPVSSKCAEIRSVPFSSSLWPEQIPFSQPQSPLDSSMSNSSDGMSYIRSPELDREGKAASFHPVYRTFFDSNHPTSNMSHNSNTIHPQDETQSNLVDGVLVQPLMPAYESAYNNISSGLESFPLEVSVSFPADAKPQEASLQRSQVVVPRISSAASEPREQSVTGQLNRRSSSNLLSARRDVRSADASARSEKSSSNTGQIKIRLREIETDRLSSSSLTPRKKPMDTSRLAALEKTDANKNISKSLHIKQMRTSSGQKKKQETIVFMREPNEEIVKQNAEAEVLDPNLPKISQNKAEIPSSAQAATEKAVVSKEAKSILGSMQRKSKKNKGMRKTYDDDLQKKRETEKVAVREARRKDAELKKLFAEERMTEKKKLEEEKRLAEEMRLMEEEKLAEKRERDEEDIAALVEKEAKLQEEILDARKKAEEAREAEEAARNALAATWKAAREHREERRRVNIEKRRQELLERSLKEQQRVEVSKRKEQDVLERIGTLEEVRRFKEAERLRKEELAHDQLLQLEEEERLTVLAFEKEEERYAEMEREAEEAAMAKLIQERLEAEQRPGFLKDKQKRLKSEELKKRSAILTETQENEERLQKMQEEEQRLEEEANQKLLDMQKMEEEALADIQRMHESRRNAALQRRTQNLENRMHLQLLKRDQTGLNQPWVFSYYIRWPRETYGKLMGQGQKKSGIRPPFRHSVGK